jgi:hypothetical protein
MIRGLSLGARDYGSKAQGAAKYHSISVCKVDSSGDLNSTFGPNVPPTSPHIRHRAARRTCRRRSRRLLRGTGKRKGLGIVACSWAGSGAAGGQACFLRSVVRPNALHHVAHLQYR